MSQEWIDLPTMQDVAKAQADRWEIEVLSYTSLNWVKWSEQVWDATRKYRARPRQPEKKRIVLRRALMTDAVGQYWITGATNIDHSRRRDFVQWLPGEEVVEVETK